MQEAVQRKCRLHKVSKKYLPHIETNLPATETKARTHIMSFPLNQKRTEKPNKNKQGEIGRKNGEGELRLGHIA